MALRFRRSLTLIPGLRVNLGKRGASLSVGGRGLSATFGPRGTYTNVGLPGTGLSYRARAESGSEQRRTAWAQQRLAAESQRTERDSEQQESSPRAKIKLSLVRDTGALQIEHAVGGPLSRQELRLLWDQKRSDILEWLKREVDAINGDVELLTTIHEDTPAPDSEPEYPLVPFDEAPPSAPQPPEARPKPEPTRLPPLEFFARLLKSKRVAHEQEQQRLDDEHAKAVRTWEVERARDLENYQAALAKYAEAKKDWDNRKREHEAAETKRRDAFPALLRTDTDVMNKTLEDALNSLTWPRQTLISYQITDAGRQVWLDVDLPEVEDLPQKVASVASTGKKVNVKDKSARQLQLEYALHIHGIAFRLVGTVFATLPTATAVVISGFSQRVDRATARVNDDYLLSVRVEREHYSKIDFDALDKINPIDAMGAFEIRRKLTSTGIFKPIEPFESGSA